MHKPICYYETLDIVPMMSSVCCLDHIAPTCTAVLHGSTPHLVVSRNLKPYSASEMFATHGSPSFFLITSEMYIQY